MEYYFDQPLRELKTQKCFQLLKLGIGLEPKLADFCIKRTDFNPQLIQLPPLFKAYGSEKLLDRHAKRLLWAVLNLNERVVFHSLSHYPCAWAQGVNPSPLFWCNKSSMGAVSLEGITYCE